MLDEEKKGRNVGKGEFRMLWGAVIDGKRF
jgi:hypothetical protein